MQKVIELSQKVDRGQERALYQVPEVKSYTADELLEIVGPAQAAPISAGNPGTPPGW